MSEIHGWKLDANKDKDSKKVPDGKSRFGINNSSSSETDVHTLINDTYIAKLDPGNQFEDMSCSPNDTIKVEAAVPGKKANGNYAFD